MAQTKGRPPTFVLFASARLRHAGLLTGSAIPYQ